MQKGTTVPSETPSVRQLRMRIETDDGDFKGLKKLKMRGKDLNFLPSCLFSIKELQVLDLSPEREACIDYHLSSIPPYIAQLTNLQVLILDTNNFFSLPEELGCLVNLKQLTLSNNFISTLPQKFENLKNLESLHFGNNNLENFPQVICQLKNLEFLDLSCNKISNLPEKINQLRNLSSLLLNCNKLEKLPDKICELENLETLWIGQNKLRNLPKNFGNLSSLDWGKVFFHSAIIDENPLYDPPIEICKLGVEEINEYFKKKNKQ